MKKGDDEKLRVPALLVKGLELEEQEAKLRSGLRGSETTSRYACYGREAAARIAAVWWPGLAEKRRVAAEQPALKKAK